jgi:hypothetical protein
MRRGRLIQTGMAAAMTLALCGCNRQKTIAPELQTTSGEKPRLEETKVTGCLKSGLAENTFVLTASKDEGAIETATYQLTGPERLGLRDYVGQKVEVAGTLRSEQEVTSLGQPTEQKPAKGTTGTPTVETKSEVDIKRMTVTTVTPTGAKCE